MIMMNKPSAFELMPILNRRSIKEDAKFFLDEAHEIIIFGSVAASLAKSSSDLDVLVVSDQGRSLKTDRLDIVGVSKEEFESYRWRSSELASHIKQYGVSLKGDMRWSVDRISQQSIDAKSRRIQTFLNSLPRSWEQFDEVFRAKYATKLRRETQRLILLENNTAIPPTRLLDEEWNLRFGSNDSVIQKLEALNRGHSSYVFEDLQERICSHLFDGYRMAASASAK